MNQDEQSTVPYSSHALHDLPEIDMEVVEAQSELLGLNG